MYFRQQNINIPKSQKIISIYVRLHNGNGCLLKVNPSISIIQLKLAIQNSDLELPARFNLIAGGRNLFQTNKSLASQGIKDLNIIHVHDIDDISPQKLKIDVSIYYQGQKFTVRIRRGQTINDLKHLIYPLVKIHPKHQILVFRGDKLDQKQKLNHYGIKTDSLLCLHISKHIRQLPSLQSQDLPQQIDVIKRASSFYDNKIDFRPFLYSSEQYLTENDESKNFGYEVQIRQNQDVQDSSSQNLGKLDFNFKMLGNMRYNQDTQTALISIPKVGFNPSSGSSEFSSMEKMIIQ